VKKEIVFWKDGLFSVDYFRHSVEEQFTCLKKCTAQRTSTNNNKNTDTLKKQLFNFLDVNKNFFRKEVLFLGNSRSKFYFNCHQKIWFDPQHLHYINKTKVNFQYLQVNPWSNCAKTNTAKLGYNELGYNEYTVIKNKMFSAKWPFYYTKQPSYNEPRF